MSTRTHFVVWILLDGERAAVLYACSGVAVRRRSPPQASPAFSAAPTTRAGPDQNARSSPDPHGELRPSASCRLRRDGESMPSRFMPRTGVAAGTQCVLAPPMNDPAMLLTRCRLRPYWKKSFLGTGVTTVPGRTGEAGDINTIIGITGKPVIDPAPVRSTSSRRQRNRPITFQRLHSADSATGNKNLAGPEHSRAYGPGTGHG